VGGGIASSMGGGGQGDNFEIVDLHICICLYKYKLDIFKHLYIKVRKCMNRDARKYELETMKKCNNSLQTFQAPLKNNEKWPLAPKAAKREYKFARMVAGRVAKQINWVPRECFGDRFRTAFSTKSQQTHPKSYTKSNAEKVATK